MKYFVCDYFYDFIELVIFYVYVCSWVGYGVECYEEIGYGYVSNEVIGDGFYVWFC